MASASTKKTELSAAEIELKRRGRRRLIGAVTIGVVAIVVLPMIFDSEPKRQNIAKQEISIQIPPKEGLASLPAPTMPPANTAPASVPPAAPALPPSSTPAVPETPIKTLTLPVEIKAASKTEPKAVAKVEPRIEPKAEPKTEPKVEKTPKVEPKVETPVAAKTGFVIQVGAFRDADNAKSIVAQLKDAKLPVYTDTIAVKTGMVTRVRVGPYTSKEKADGALAEVKLAGGDGKVVPIQ